MPFSPSRIRQNILSRQLDTRDPLPTIRDASPEKSATSEDGDADSSSTTLPPDSPPPRPRAARSSSYEASNLPNPEDITEDSINKHMYTSNDPPLDLFVRTSGVERLSDFMLWQCHQDTQIFFLDCLWPEFDLQHFIKVLLEWQWRKKASEREEAPNKRGRNGKGLRLQE